MTKSIDGESTGMSNESDTTKNGPSVVDKFVIRLPSGLRSKIKELSEQNRRSMNAEIIMVLEKHIQQSMTSKELNDLLECDHAELTDRQLSEKLDALPPGKKEALLELLG